MAPGTQPVYNEGLLWIYLQQEPGTVISVTVSDESCYCRVFGE